MNISYLAFAIFINYTKNVRLFLCQTFEILFLYVVADAARAEGVGGGVKNIFPRKLAGVQGPPVSSCIFAVK